MRNAANNCQKPDRDCPKIKCGYPLPCPWHTDVIIEDGKATFLSPIHGRTRRAIIDIARKLTGKSNGNL